jgi:saccharopine dehydrogenase-like NADP-dependent oxidoreductase
MSQILTVMGATGAQGSSVVNHALKDGKYKIRAVTRNVNSEKAKALASRGVEVVAADINSEESLLKAFEVSVVFLYVLHFPLLMKMNRDLLQFMLSQTSSNPSLLGALKTL